MAVITRIPVVLLILSASVCALEEGGSERYVTKVYDVGFLTRSVKDHECKEMGLLPVENYEPPKPAVASGGLEAETVLAMMQGLTLDWEEPASIQNTEGYIVVVHKAAVHRRMEALVESLKRKRGTTVTCVVRVYAVEAPTGLAGRGVFGAEAGEAMWERLGTSSALRLVQAWTLTGVNGQKVAAWEGRERTYLRDYDPQVAQESSMADPLVATLREGFAFAVRCTVAGSGHVLADVKASVASLAGEMEDKDFKTEGLGVLEKPEVAVQSFETSLLVPVDGVALIGSFEAEAATEKGKPGGESAGEGSARPADAKHLFAIRVHVREAFEEAKRR